MQKIIVISPSSSEFLFENAMAERNPEFPNWVDIREVDESNKAGRILAMIPAGWFIAFNQDGKFPCTEIWNYSMKWRNHHE